MPGQFRNQDSTEALMALLETFEDYFVFITVACIVDLLVS